MQGLHSTSTSGWSSFSIFVIMVALLLTMMRPVQPLALRVRSSSAAARSVAVRRSQSSLFCTSLPTTTTTTTQATTSAPHLHDDILQQYEQELIALRGKPELVDRLENLVSRYPGVEMNPALYRLLYPFAIDDFQADGIQALRDGQNVLVMTPTGSGKTLVGELAIYFALMLKLRVAYTTPLKALSNQKFQDFSRKFGADRVGLLTGDISINRNAQILVMTTEVFRNMIYDTEDMQQLNDVFMVCFDEFHYMNDPERGTVWEESVISCPTHIRILALSATMGNVEDVQDWIGSIHGPTTLVQSNHRPVPLRYYYALKKSLLPFFRDHNAGPGAINGIIRQADGNFDANMKVNPAIINLEEEAMTRTTVERRGRSTSFRSAPVSILIPKYTDVVKALQKSSKLPAIFFIFSRVGCEEAAKTTVTAKLNLLSMEELQLMNKAIALFIRNNPLIPITRQNILMLQAGVGVHHAGLIGVWKSFIEDLFNANVIKVLYATETLAAGKCCTSYVIIHSIKGDLSLF